MTEPFAVRGRLMHAPARDELEVLADGVVVVGADGAIAAVGPADAPGCLEFADIALPLTPAQVLIPGLVDAHVHAPQWPQMGRALDLPLERWLQHYTFPLEARYADLEFAETMYRSLVRALIDNGTTSALFFATIHVDATLLLGKICRELGQRALIGHLVMDNPDECPDYYRQPSASIAIDDTRRFIDQLGTGDDVMPVVTPRFIPSCTDEALTGLGRVVAETGVAVQTHCSESDWQHRYVLDRHGRRDTESLDHFGLLTERTVLAHSNFIDAGDMALIGGRGAAVAHCPLSNFYFSNAVFPARRALDAGLKIALGTDIGGGPSPSILRNCGTAVSASRALEEGVDAELARERRGRDGSRISASEAFWMATRGGAEALNAPAGAFVPGLEFDALVVDSAVPSSDLHFFPGLDDDAGMCEKLVYNATAHNIVKVWRGGRVLKDTTI